jgi:aryl-alcohol dehydrogenase-like predicted oxidoreductase
MTADTNQNPSADIERLNFGPTGHDSSRVIFGAAALGGMRQEKADGLLELVMQAGINHIDTAASYGDSELRLAPFLVNHRDDVFLATKTGFRDGARAREELERSLQRMQVSSVDLIQLHNLTDQPGWEEAMSSGGAVEALVQAKSEGLVKHIGVTGHGTYAAEMHLKSLNEYDFASVLVPYNYSMRQNPEFAADLEKLIATCQERNVAIQTIKAVARRRWTDDDPDKRFSWYMPIRDPQALQRAVSYVLGRPGLFLNTTSDATILPAVFAAAAGEISLPTDAQMAADAESLGIEPLFVRDVSDDVRVA